MTSSLPERKGLLCVLLGGLEGIRVSKFTSEAPVGPRKASGVRHTRVDGALSGGASRDRSNISGLADSRPFTWGFTEVSVPNRSALESVSANGSESDFTPNSSASVREKLNKKHNKKDAVVLGAYAYLIVAFPGDQTTVDQWTMLLTS